MDDEEFQRHLANARNGDERAFAALWRAFNPPLTRFLVALAGRDDADDQASTVWLDVVRRLDGFSGSVVGFRAWIFTIARSRVIDLRRARRRRPQSAEGDQGLDSRLSPAADPASVVDERLSTDDAVDLIGSLPPDQAEVLLLRIIADLDVATVAEITGKRPGTVRVLAHRGLRRLAERLDEKEGEAEM
jgi:RNA polymerase sigma-70 factor (ECF subfamily)